MGGFGVFLLLLFLAFLTYMVVAMVLQRMKGATGLETIPHLAFWMGLPARAKVRETILRQHLQTPVCIFGCFPSSRKPQGVQNYH